MSDPSVAFLGAGLVAASGLLPSDYTLMVFFLAVVHVAVTIAALFGASVAAKSSRRCARSCVSCRWPRP